MNAPFFQKASTAAEFAAIWEPKGLFATDKKRHDDMLCTAKKPERIIGAYAETN